MVTAKQIGAAGEDQALAYLQSHGFQLIARNITTPFGEIDLLCRYGNVWHCIEVKRRRSHRYGQAIEAVTPRKLERMIQSAQWVVQKQYFSGSFQIDVVTFDNGIVAFHPNVTL